MLTVTVVLSFLLLHTNIFSLSLLFEPFSGLSEKFFPIPVFCLKQFLLRNLSPLPLSPLLCSLPVKWLLHALTNEVSQFLSLFIPPSSLPGSFFHPPCLTSHQILSMPPQKSVPLISFLPSPPQMSLYALGEPFLPPLTVPSSLQSVFLALLAVFLSKKRMRYCTSFKSYLIDACCPQAKVQTPQLGLQSTLQFQSSPRHPSFSINQTIIWIHNHSSCLVLYSLNMLHLFSPHLSFAC